MYQYGQMYLISSIQTTNNTKRPTYYNQHHDSPTQCSLTIVVSRLPYRVSTPQSRPGQMHDHAIWWGPSWSGYNRKQPEHWTNSKPNSNPNHHPNKYQTDQFQNYLTSTWNTNRTNIKPTRTDPYKRETSTLSRTNLTPHGKTPHGDSTQQQRAILRGM